MASNYDIIVIGAGAMGSAAAYHASKDGQRVLLLEQFEIDHQMGSSYGASRIIRYVYEHPVYVNLARAAYDAWRVLEAEAGEELYVKTGGINFAPRGNADFALTVKTLQASAIPFDLLNPDELHLRFPQFRIAEGMEALYQEETGLLAASRCVRAYVRLAQRYGAVVVEKSSVAHIKASTVGVEVTTAKGTYSAGKLILVPGAWVNQLLKGLGMQLPLRVVKTQEIYFQSSHMEDYQPGRFPAFIAHLEDEFGHSTYGIPSYDNSGVKIGLHGGEDFDYTSSERTADQSAIARSFAFAQKYMPEGGWMFQSARACLYTYTPDEHFIIDQHPEYPHVILASVCSGHGFKFSAVIGEILSDLAIKGETQHDIDLFRTSRFASVSLP
jgi:monomeric sarcosine oxidase